MISAFRKLSSLSLLPIALAISSCSTSDLNIFDVKEMGRYDFAVNQLISSEASGRLGSGSAKVIARGVAQAQLVSDVDDINYTVNPDIRREEIFLDGILEVGLFKRLDVFYNDGAGAKIQLFGEPKSERKDGYSLAVTYTSLLVNHEDETSDGTGSVKKGRADVRGSGDKYNLIFGKRLSPKTLYYTGAFYSQVKVDKVHLFQTNNTNFTSSADVNKGEGSAYGANLGFQHDNDKRTLWDFFTTTMGLEIAYARVKWEKTFAVHETKSKDAFGVGGQLGLSW